MVIQIATKFNPFFLLRTLDPSIKFCCNLFITFCDVANRQKNNNKKQTNATENIMSLLEIFLKIGQRSHQMLECV